MHLQCKYSHWHPSFRSDETIDATINSLLHSKFSPSKSKLISSNGCEIMPGWRRITFSGGLLRGNHCGFLDGRRNFRWKLLERLRIRVTSSCHKHGRNGMHTRSKHRWFILNRNQGILFLPANLFLFPGIEKTLCAIIFRDLSKWVSYTGWYTKVGGHGFPVDGLMPAHKTRNLCPLWARILSASNQTFLRFLELGLTADKIRLLFEIHWLVVPEEVAVRVDRRGLKDRWVSSFKGGRFAADKREEVLQTGANS